ncbi:hypothetical protein EVAR_102696_1 [Eumeta japonica]|uniref:Secreted protein n=1 Tax=Eumeta variegata TaxID=151549 RepID=A0A4C1TKN6_EUMVA|nr:hypothetical protein EVAR_102696_1 [Eumeta japonica]
MYWRAARNPPLTLVSVLFLRVSIQYRGDRRAPGRPAPVPAAAQVDADGPADGWTDARIVRCGDWLNGIHLNNR